MAIRSEGESEGSGAAGPGTVVGWSAEKDVGDANRYALSNHVDDDGVHRLLGQAREVSVLGQQRTANFSACGMEALSLNIALNPSPLGPGPMNRRVPLPALKALCVHDAPFATPGNVRAWRRMASVGPCGAVIGVPQSRQATKATRRDAPAQLLATNFSCERSPRRSTVLPPGWTPRPGRDPLVVGAVPFETRRG
jgi:hypothetical protein